MSLCDRCYSPGACCKNMGLFQEGAEQTFWKKTLEADAKAALREQELPFEISKIVAEYIDQESGDIYVTAVFSCPKLGEDGRCTIYEDRPGTCRRYEPASDQLCVHYNGAEGFSD